MLRHSQSDTHNPNVVDWTDRYRDADNTQFFSDAIADLSDNHGLGLIGLVGSRDLPGVAVRRAQSILRWDRRPSLWSHAFPLMGGGAIRAVALPSRAGHFPEPADQGVPNHSSAMVGYSFEEIQLDLTPGARDRNSAPEHLWNGARWWDEAFGEFDRPIAGRCVPRDCTCSVLGPGEQ